MATKGKTKQKKSQTNKKSKEKSLKFKVDHSVRINKPASVIFEAISSPVHLNRYFTAKAEGNLEKGKAATWTWVDHPKAIPVKVTKSKPPKFLVFQWPSHTKSYLTTVRFDLDDQGEKGTIVRMREGTWEASAAGLSNSYNNSGGWMHMLCCLKAYLEFSVDLRSKPIPENWK